MLGSPFQPGGRCIIGSRVLVVVPTYNERENVAPLIRELARAGRRRSTSGWPTTAAPTAPRTRCGRRWPSIPGRVELLEREEKGGRGAAVHRRLQAGPARPARLRRPLRDGRRLLAPPARDPEVPGEAARPTTWSSARRYVPGGGTSEWGVAARRCSPGWPTSTSSSWPGCPIRDTTSGYRAYRRAGARGDASSTASRSRATWCTARWPTRPGSTASAWARCPSTSRTGRARPPSSPRRRSTWPSLNFALLRFRYGFRPAHRASGREATRRRRSGSSLDASSWPAMNVLMVTSSYPKFPGDVTAPFIESIARGVAARGPRGGRGAARTTRPAARRRRAGAVLPLPLRARATTWSRLGLRAEPAKPTCACAAACYLLAPLAALAAARGASGARLRERRYDVVHVHWVVPNAALVADIVRAHGAPLVVSLHGSDVFLAERLAPARLLARRALRAAGAVTACSGDLRASARWPWARRRDAHAHRALRRGRRRLLARAARAPGSAAPGRAARTRCSCWPWAAWSRRRASRTWWRRPRARPACTW